MALKSVLELVKNKLPYLPADTSKDDLINDYKIEQYYFLQPYLNTAAANLENDNHYIGIARLLIVELVVYNMIVNKVLLNMEGSQGAAATGSKKIKKGKADVGEAEFEYANAADGNTLLMKTESLLPQVKQNICHYAATLKISLPMCVPESTKYRPIPFISYV